MMGDKNVNLVIGICILFIALFFAHHFILRGNLFDFTGFGIYGHADYKVHEETAQGILFPGEQDCGQFEDKEVCIHQHYLFHLIAAPFAQNEKTFFYFVMIFIGLVFPLTIYHITKEPASAYFFFTVTNFFWFGRAVFTTIIAVLLMFLLFVFKKWWQRIIILGVMITTHSMGFYLGIGTLLLIYLFENNWRVLIPSIFAGCNSEYYQEFVQGVSTKTGIAFIGHIDLNEGILRIGDLLGGLFWNAPLPFFLIAVKGFFDQKHFPFLALLLTSVLFIGLTWRFRFLLGLLTVIGVSFAYSTMTPKHKRWMLIGAAIMGIIQFINFSWETMKFMGIIC